MRASPAPLRVRLQGVENYQGEGVLFRGNLRGDPSAAHAKMKSRLKVLKGGRLLRRKSIGLLAAP